MSSTRHRPTPRVLAPLTKSIAHFRHQPTHAPTPVGRWPVSRKGKYLQRETKERKKQQQRLRKSASKKRGVSRAPAQPQPSSSFRKTHSPRGAQSVKSGESGRRGSNGGGASSLRRSLRSCCSFQCRLHGTRLGEGATMPSGESPGMVMGNEPSRSLSSACRCLELMGFHLWKVWEGGGGWIGCGRRRRWQYQQPRRQRQAAHRMVGDRLPGTPTDLCLMGSSYSVVTASSCAV